MAKPPIPHFLEILKDCIDEEETKKRLEHTHDTLRHYPSSASIRLSDGAVAGACLRQLFYRSKRTPESNPKDLTSKLQAGFGSAIHDWLLKRLSKSKKIRLLSEAEGRTTIDPLTSEISFRLDGLVTYAGEQGCLEIKTMQSFGLQRMVREGGPRDSDFAQVLSYFGTNDSLRWCSLVYFGRDTAFRAEYWIWKDDEGKYWCQGVVPQTSPKEVPFTFGQIVERWKELEIALEKDLLPKRDYSVVLDKEGKPTAKRTKNHVDYTSNWRCMYCPYLDHCWSSPGAVEDSIKIGG